MSLEIEIVTPERLMYENQGIDAIEVPTVSGNVTILPGHIPLLSMVTPGALILDTQGRKESIAIDQGFMRVFGNRVSILTEAAINVEDIDVSKVEEARRRAEEALEEGRKSDLAPEEIERLESVARFSIAQTLASHRK